jgi:ATP-dependent DNA ligase
MSSPAVRVEIREGKTMQECINNEVKKLRTRYVADGYIEIPYDLQIYGSNNDEQEKFIFDYIKDHESKEIKPMGCYDGNKYPIKKYAKYLEPNSERYLLVSAKIDGIRATCQLVNGEVEFRTKSGKLIKSMDHMKDHPFLHLVNHPLDGEIYIHGKPLQYIKGLAKRQYSDDETAELEYIVYDAVMDVSAYDRSEMLMSKYDDFCNFNAEIPNGKIYLADSVMTNDYHRIPELMNKFIADGYEGCVVRTSTGMYRQGKKGPEMVKYKPYQDDEFDVLGTQDGRRPEDYVVVCRTKDGEMFNAKPMGTVEERMELYEEIMKVTDRPRKGTVKYFTLSEKGIPTQPQFKCIRDDGD